MVIPTLFRAVPDGCRVRSPWRRHRGSARICVLAKTGHALPFPLPAYAANGFILCSCHSPKRRGRQAHQEDLNLALPAGQDLAVSPSEQSTNCHDLYDGLVMAQGAPLAKQFTFSERGGSGLVGTVRTFPPHPPTRARKDVEGDEVDVGTLSQNSLPLSLSRSLCLSLASLACLRAIPIPSCLGP